MGIGQSHHGDSAPLRSEIEGVWVGHSPTQTPKSYLFWDWPSKNQVDAIALLMVMSQGIINCRNKVSAARGQGDLDRRAHNIKKHPEIQFGVFLYGWLYPPRSIAQQGGNIACFLQHRIAVDDLNISTGMQHAVDSELDGVRDLRK
jgi:hypothetical protein